MKTIIVTGDSRGVGFQISRDLLKEGHKVIGISRKESKNTSFLNESYNNRYFHLNFDMTNSNSIKELYFEKLKPHGPFDAFVNNAAMAYDDIATNLNNDNLLAMFQVNVFSPMCLVKYLIRDSLLHKNQMNLVHISSISAHTGFKGLSFYASSKGAIEAFSKNIAREWGSRGIYSNVVCPGFMETDMSSGLSNQQKNKIFKRSSTKKPTTTNHVSKSVFFLITQNTGEITGQVIHVDNGAI